MRLIYFLVNVFFYPSPIFSVCCSDWKRRRLRWLTRKKIVKKKNILYFSSFLLRFSFCRFFFFIKYDLICLGATYIYIYMTLVECISAKKNTLEKELNQAEYEKNVIILQNRNRWKAENGRDSRLFFLFIHICSNNSFHLARN